MKRSVIRELFAVLKTPDYATLHPGYGAVNTGTSDEDVKINPFREIELITMYKIKLQKHPQTMYDNFEPYYVSDHPEPAEGPSSLVPRPCR